MRLLTSLAGLVVLASTLGQQASPALEGSLDVDSLRAGRIVFQEDGKPRAILGDVNGSYMGDDPFGIVFLDEDENDQLFVTLDRQGLGACRISRTEAGTPVMGARVRAMGPSIAIGQISGTINMGIGDEGPSLNVNHRSWMSTFDLLKLRGGEQR